MASAWNAALCAILAALFWSGLGWAIGRRLLPTGPLTSGLAPALGWAVFNAAALLLFLAVGFTAVTVGTTFALTMLAALASLLLRAPVRAEPPIPSIPALAWLAAALLAAVPACVLLPKTGADGVHLAVEAFDHAKVAMIDDMARLGLPHGNPFFGGADAAPRLGYYYLWHFSAAELALLTRSSGWEADVGLAWFTGFAALAAMMGLAVHVARRGAAALWAVLLAGVASLRPALALVLGREAMARLLSGYPGLQGWLVQATWVPQHVASASSMLVAVVLLSALAQPGLAQPGGWAIVPVLGLTAAAAFESSTWIGGVTFAAVAPALAGVLLLSLPRGSRRIVLARATVAGIIALAAALPFLRDEYLATAARAAGVPIAVWPYEVLGRAVPDGLRRLLDLPAFWTVLLVIEYPAIWLAGTASLWLTLRDRALAGGDRLLVRLLAALIAASLGVTWLLISTITNNDLGWRAVLPAILVLTSFAAAGVARWLAGAHRIAGVLAVALAGLGLLDTATFLRDSITGLPSNSAARFADAPALWAAVRRHTGAAERVSNNPLALADEAAWPVNIGWALLADRRSCFAGRELALAYVGLPAPETERLERFFDRVFAGDASPEDVLDLAIRYHCRVIVLTPEDGAWARDVFAANPAYRLIEEQPARWRIYRATTGDAPG